MDQEKQWKLSTMMILAMITWGYSWTNAKTFGIYTTSSYNVLEICNCFNFLFFIIIVREPLRIPAKAIPIIIINSIFIIIYIFFNFKGTQIGVA